MSAAPPLDTESVPRAVWSSTALRVLGRLWAAACGFGCLAFLTRLDLPWAPLPAAEFGQLTFYLALYMLLDCLADFGTSAATIQLGAGDANVLGAAIRAGRRIRAGAALAGFGLVMICAWAAEERELGWIALASLAPLARSAELSAAIYQDQIRWAVPVGVRSLVASARLGLFALLATAGVDHFGPYLAGYALLGAAGNLGLYLAARPALAAVRPPGGTPTWQARVVGGRPPAAVVMAQQAYFYGDNLVLRAMVGAEELGHYNAAVKLLSLLIMISAFATSGALPWLARRTQAGQLAAASERLVQRLLLPACLLLGALWPHAGSLLSALFGQGFESAGPSLQWLLLAAAVIYAGAPLLTALVAAGRPRAVLLVVLSGLAFNLIMNALLIPSMGISGAGLATLGTELWVAGFAYRALGRRGLRLGQLVLGPLLFAGSAALSWALFN